MKFLAAIILLGTLAMLAVHLASWKLVQAWYGAPASWLGRHLSPMRVLRGEALYWVLVLAAWPLWHSWLMRGVVVVFSAIHLSGWLAAEANRPRVQAGPSTPVAKRKLAVAITVFDLIETLALLAVGWWAASFWFLS